MVSKQATPVARRSSALPIITGLVRVYAGLLVVFLLFRYGLGDRTSWSFAANSLSVYAFLPAPLVLVAAIYFRHRESFAIVGLSALLFIWHWGGLLLPRGREPNAADRSIRVMTYNALGYNLDTAGTVRTILEAKADIVALQELAPEHADALERDFSATYPHRLMDPRPGVTGSGLLSRFPLRKIDGGPLDRLPWIGTPMVVELDVDGRPVVFVNFHTYAGPATFVMREKQARALAEFAAAHPGPLILAGDLNATDQSAAYATIARTMRDAWREAGWGLGHTFPGKPTPDVGGSRPVILGIPVPLWLVRIDYIFHSDSFVTLEARIGPDDGGSDHRPVLATLSFQ